MALTFGFYDSVSGDRKYNARQMSTLFEGIIRDGVFKTVGDGFLVKPAEGNVVTVGIGRAWFSSTWTHNDSPFQLDLGPASTAYDRIDDVVIEVNMNDAVRANSIKRVSGAQAPGVPGRPTLSKSNGVYQYAIASVLRRAGSTAITAADITRIVGRAETPWVSSPLEVVPLDTYLDTWQLQWQRWYSENTAAGTNALESWRAAKQGEFDSWFANIKGSMTGDVAANLTAKVNALEAALGTITTHRYVNTTVQDSSGDTISDSSGNAVGGTIVYEIAK